MDLRALAVRILTVVSNGTINVYKFVLHTCSKLLGSVYVCIVYTFWCGTLKTID